MIESEDASSVAATLAKNLMDVAKIKSSFEKLARPEGAGYAIGDIRIGSESMESKDGKPRNVSTIEIQVKRNA